MMEVEKEQVGVVIEEAIEGENMDIESEPDEDNTDEEDTDTDTMAAEAMPQTTMRTTRTTRTTRTMRTNTSTKQKKKTPEEMDAEWEWRGEEIEVPAIQFNLTPGPRNCPAKLTVFEAFETIFPAYLFDHIVTKTNEYARARNDFHNLGSLEKKELFTYTAILLAMCLRKAPALKDHWSKDSLLGSSWISERMSRNRWLAIHKALQFDIIRVEEAVRTASQKHWIPSQKVCIDEGIGPWQGRKKGVRVYIRGKPHPNGVKVYMLADENNFAYDFWIYRGVQPSIADLVLAFVKKLPGWLSLFT